MFTSVFHRNIGMFIVSSEFRNVHNRCSHVDGRGTDGKAEL